MEAAASEARFDPADLPLDAALDPARRGPAYGSDREALEAFENAYEDVDLNRMQEIWWRLNARQRLAAYEAGRELSDSAPMSAYVRMLPAEYLLEAESRSDLERSASLEAGGEAPEAANAAVATSQENEIPDSERGTLRGFVLVEGTGEPVDGVEIVATPRGPEALLLMMGAGEALVDVSGPDGSFEIARIPAGEISIVGQKLPAYPLISRRTTIVAQDTVEFRIEVPPIRPRRLELPVVLAGVVRDALTGEPVTGVHVSAGRHGGAQSDARGRYLIREADLGEIELSTEHPDYQPSTSNLVAETRGRLDHDLSIQPITTGAIEGIVVDRTTGEPLAGAIVAFSGTEIEADAEGRFRLDEVEAGELTLTAHRERYRATVSQVLLERRATAEARLELDPITEGSVLGVVTDASTGRPLAGARVRIGPNVAATGADGRFELVDVPAGEANVTAEKSVFEPASETVRVVAAESVAVEIELDPITYGSITGVVVDAVSGRPIAKAKVAVQGATAETDAQGRFSLERVPAGRVQLSASRRVYAPARQNLELEPAATLERRLALEPITTGRLAGRVVDAETRQPITGAEVSFSTQSTTSGRDGRFEADGVTAGQITVSARKTAYHSGGVTVRLEPAGSTDALVELEPIKIGTVLGVVKDAKTGEPIPGARVACGGKSVEADAQGRFRCDEITAGAAGVSVRHADYGDGAASGTLVGAGTLELEVRLDLRREDVTQLESALASKGVIDLYGIHFDSGKDQFKPSSLGTLNAVLQVIKRAPGKTFRIAGHTDSDSTEAYNQDLSERRARTVIEWLVERGIEPQRLKVVGYGESRPAAPNDTSSGKALNRRVELSYVR